jgi:hypothetical protein
VDQRCARERDHAVGDKGAPGDDVGCVVVVLVQYHCHTDGRQGEPEAQEDGTRLAGNKLRSKDSDGDQVFDGFVLQEEEQFDLIDAHVDEEDYRRHDETEGEDDGEVVQVQRSLW